MLETKLHSEAKTNHRLLFFVLTGALLLYFLRFGYDYGVSDQDDVLPYLMHRLDPSWFAQDWFVLAQAAELGVRSYFVMILHALSLVLPVWLAILFLYVLTWLVLAWAVYHIAYALTQHVPAAAAAVVLALILTPQWTLGGNDLAHSVLVPSMAGWGLGLWGVLFFLRRQYVRSAALMGLATWMQSLVGMQLAGLTGFVLLWGIVQKKGSLRTLAAFSVTYLLVALPTLGPLIYQQLQATATSGAGEEPSMFYILALFRNPHHYLFFSFPDRSFVRFGLLLVFGMGSLFVLARKGQLFHRSFVVQVLVGVGLFCAFGFLFTEVFPTLLVAQLQLFKTTVLAKLLFVSLIAGAVFAVLPTPLANLSRRLLSYHSAGLAVVGVAWVGVIGAILAGYGPLQAKTGHLTPNDSPLTQVEAWARTQTPREAVFAIPLSWSAFRSHAQRAIVVNFKSVPYKPGLNRMWFERLTTMGPISLPDRASPSLQDRLDAAYHQLSSGTLLALSDRYAFDYVVRNRPLDTDLPSISLAFSADPWYVYKMQPEERTVE